MAIADQENNSTLGRVVSGSVEAVNPKVVRPASPASKGNDNCRIEEFKDDHSDSMEYAWLEPRGHDPIATDTNLAEIDFENFRNEDLAYAFSCGVSSLFIHKKPEGSNYFALYIWFLRLITGFYKSILIDKS